LYLAILQDAKFSALLLRIDLDLAAAARAAGCHCGGALHRANYPRKPRGGPNDLGPEHNQRFSFCCGIDGCRQRTTPPSLRFLGRKVYFAAVVVLVTAMRHGATPERVQRLRELVGVSRRTLERWRAWWRTAFAQGSFWRAAAGVFMPPVETSLLPASLLDRFESEAEARVVALLRFLGPITSRVVVAHAH
jgi:hypothetical protein